MIIICCGKETTNDLQKNLLKKISEDFLIIKKYLREKNSSPVDKLLLTRKKKCILMSKSALQHIRSEKILEMLACSAYHLPKKFFTKEVNIMAAKKKAKKRKAAPKKKGGKKKKR